MVVMALLLIPSQPARSNSTWQVFACPGNNSEISSKPESVDYGNLGVVLTFVVLNAVSRFDCLAVWCLVVA